MIRITNIIAYIEQTIPPTYQEKYDNCGLILGNAKSQATGILCSLDCTLEVLEEAVHQKCNLVITHHPLIFEPLKKITHHTNVGQCIRYAMQNDITLYALHTNFDNVLHGVNQAISKLLGLESLRILKPKDGISMLLTTFSPPNTATKIRDALFSVGAGTLGNYSCCSFSSEGLGRFKPLRATQPYIGEKHHLQEVQEQRIEVLVPQHLIEKAVKALLEAHPYEEPMYYVQPLSNHAKDVGSGMIGQLPKPLNPKDFLALLKQSFKTAVLRHTPHTAPIQRVAVCGGAGASLLSHALTQKADAFITADISYHRFLDAQNKLLFVDIGHYESEIIVQQHMYNLLSQKFTHIPLFAATASTNPIGYY